jgi:ribosomal protein S18 acetylase RimI-like enzyme
MTEAAGSEKIALRPASIADESYLLALRQETMDPHFARLGQVPTENFHLERVRQHYDDTPIIHCDGAAVGMLKAYRAGGEWVLSQLQIAPPYQGRGLGERVVSVLLSTAREVLRSAPDP